LRSGRVVQLEQYVDGRQEELRQQALQAGVNLLVRVGTRIHASSVQGDDADGVQNLGKSKHVYIQLRRVMNLNEKIRRNHRQELWTTVEGKYVQQCGHQDMWTLTNGHWSKLDYHYVHKSGPFLSQILLKF
jgi:hypothetical protein